MASKWGEFVAVWFRAPQAAVLVVGLAAATLVAFRARPRWASFLAAAMVVTSLAWHTAALLLYWQMLPAYAGSLLLMVPLWVARLSDVQRRVMAAAAGALIAFSAISVVVVPMFRLPAPTGSFAVGTAIVHLVDPGRADATFRSGHREWMVQVWYPARAGSSGRPAPYRRWSETTLLSSYQAVLATHSRLGTPVADGRFPLLLFNPAWEGQRTQNTFLVEDLASHGFVVAAIDHTHNSSPVAFPDGQVVRASEPREVDDFTNVSMDQVLGFANQELATQVADDSRTLDAFAAWARDPATPWYRHVDLTRAGAFGHSFGGAVAVAACARDPRIQAALNMDGWLYGALDPPPAKPLFVISNEDWPFNPQNVARERRSSRVGDRLDIADLDATVALLQGSGGYMLAISGMEHMDFTDRPLYSPVRRLTGSGPRDAGAGETILRAYTLAFFSSVLRGTHEPLLSAGSYYPETHFKAW